MTDKEAVDFLKKARIYLSVPRGNAKQITQELYIEAMTKAINALEEKTKALPLPDRPHGEWIPVSERLPEDDRPVLIYAWNVHHVVARYGQFRTEDGGYKKAWVTAGAWFGNEEIKHKVIAWMPLPEPYQKEGESE